MFHKLCMDSIDTQKLLLLFEKLAADRLNWYLRISIETINLVTFQISKRKILATLVILKEDSRFGPFVYLFVNQILLWGVFSV